MLEKDEDRMQTYRDLTLAVARRRPQMLEMIARLVGLESPTDDRVAVNRCVRLLEEWIAAQGKDQFIVAQPGPHPTG